MMEQLEFKTKDASYIHDKDELIDYIQSCLTIKARAASDIVIATDRLEKMGYVWKLKNGFSFSIECIDAEKFYKNKLKEIRETRRK